MKLKILQFILGIIILELSLQLAYRIKNNHWAFESTGFRIGYTMPVNDRRMYCLRPNYSDPRWNININEYGFRRSPDNEVGKDKFILAVGDSCPFGALVKDDESYPAYISNYGYKVINASVPSYNLRQSLDTIKYSILTKYNKDQIKFVLVNAANDVSLLIKYLDKWNIDRTWDETKFKHTWKVKIFGCSGIYLYGWGFIERTIDRILKKYPPNIIVVPDYVKRSWEAELYLMLDKEIGYYSSLNIPIILISSNPNFCKNPEYESQWVNLIDSFNHILERISEKYHGVYYFTDQPTECKYFNDIFHYNIEGNKLMANNIIKFINILEAK